MWDGRDHANDRPSRRRRSGRAHIAAYLIVLLGLGEPVTVCGPVQVNWLPFASDRVPSSEETGDAEQVALHVLPCASASRHQAPATGRPVHSGRDGHPPLRTGLYRLSLRQPNLPCGAVVPIRC
jgi:hypothetical protein